MTEIRFGTDGWRAVIAREFTFRNFGYVVQTLANLLVQERLPGQPVGNRRVLVAYDARAMARDFAEEAVGVLESNGLSTALTARPTPTPALAHAIVDQGAVCGLVLTASHNPAKYMGIKFIPWYAGPAVTEITKAIEIELEAVVARGEVKRSDSIHPDVLDPRPAYFAAIRRLVNLDAIRDAGLRICVDPMHGVTGGYIDTLLRAAGCDVRAIRADANPSFGGGVPEPAEERLAVLADEVTTNFLDLGLANDGDGDRFGIIDSTGAYVNACDYMGILADYHLKEKRPADSSAPIRMARTVATSHLMDAVCERSGAAVTETPVGFKWLGEELRTGAYLAGEESGGMSRSDHIPEKDGVFACLLAAEIVAVRGEPLSRVAARLHKECGPYLWFRQNLHLTPDGARKVMEGIRVAGEAGRIADRAIVRIDDRDGVKMHLEDGSWLLGRPSGTEPVVRIYAEGRSEKAQADLRKAVNRLVSEL